MRRFLLLFIFLFSTIFYAQEKKTDTLPQPKWKVHGRVAFLFNQSTFSNWASGGENTVAGNIDLNYDFNYKRKNLNWDNKLLTGYGLSHISGKGYRKTNDRFEFNSLLGIKSKNYWFFSFFTNFKTQYTTGFDYSVTPNVSVSDFFSPAYLSFGPGMLWKKSDNLHVNIAPATSRFTFVNDQFSGKFGVEEGKNTSFSLGFNLSSYYKFRVMENIKLENILSIYSDYLNKPQNIDIEYQTNLFLLVNKYITMNITFHMVIDDNASSKIQFREVFGLGAKYSFHKKVTFQ
ncbi:DUF3078 domain-containing protein [Polaribacter sp. MSW13]|uniref:DUF3078 domain-containing protein n=1 Tax=Polaribacter marinus TaxID=2916838 RepID=A0A9X2AMR7_9FLAO|nr:DUF3078 domain-containing protein [Polaribacter marinus]MCI2229214.1 DUF3078 domain-containing protein [Polaribacter marinus]